MTLRCIFLATLNVLAKGLLASLISTKLRCLSHVHCCKFSFAYIGSG